MKQLLLLIGSSLFSALLAVYIYKEVSPPTTIILENSPVKTALAKNDVAADWVHTMDSPARKDFPNFTRVAEKTTPAVVNVKSIRPSNYRLFGFDMPSSTGSGVIISSNGFIVTNNHVIDGGEYIEITLYDKREYKAKVVGVDPTTDLALLKIESDQLPYMQFANSDSLFVGEWVIAVGNPFNLESTVTAGIVSAKGRSINILDNQYKIESFIQTDAVINPGNSGGALVNVNGGLVGINTAIVTNSGKYEGYSFAIPANLVIKVVRDLKEFGKVQRGLLGIQINELRQAEAAAAGLKPGEGVLITYVTPGSAAHDAGIKDGDVLFSINNKQIKTVPELQEFVARYRPGEQLNVRYFRNGKPVETIVTLREIADTGEPIFNDIALNQKGLDIRPMSDQETRRHGHGGCVVQSVARGSAADKANIEPGFVIRKVNGKKVKTLKNVIDLTDRGGKIVIEGIYMDFPGEFKYIF